MARPSDHATTHAPLLERLRRAPAVRSLLVGALATGIDLAGLAALVGLVGVSARAANVPSLLAGALVQFLGNRYFAFEGARERSAARQAALFAAVEVLALAFNASLYDLVARAVVLDALLGSLARLGTSAAVFLLWSLPLWHLVFRGPRLGAERAVG